ncbi:MAG: LysM peptidoglycan-binding domain-containing protein, partial [Actinobacteria bacterium]|nr:LysM peptidoglycan-binding domain-containing protein [Actinomycetota bacterium]
TYRVRSGDTLWSIADSLDVAGDRRGIVEALSEANGGSEIQAGDDLIIPASLGSVR